MQIYLKIRFNEKWDLKWDTLDEILKSIIFSQGATTCHEGVGIVWPQEQNYTVQWHNTDLAATHTLRITLTKVPAPPVQFRPAQLTQPSRMLTLLSRCVLVLGSIMFSTCSNFISSQPSLLSDNHVCIHLTK